MTGYLFQVDSNGKIIAGQAVEGWINGDENVWNAQERAFYDATTGKWTIYDPIQINAPFAANVNTAFTVTATLPANSPDTSVEFNVSYNGQAGTPVSVTVTNFQATQQFSFAQAGKYTITVSSTHHGSVSAGGDGIMSVNIKNINGTIVVERDKTNDEIQQENEQILSQTIAQLTLDNADLKTQLQTLAQTIATMQLGGV